MARLLIVEDDHDLAAIVCDCLTYYEHKVDYADTGTEALEFLRAGLYDMLILDWDLPDMTGIEICKYYRSTGGLSPVLMLTGRQEMMDKETGFDAGADDYLTKPFDLKELAVRVKALLRRVVASNLAAATAAGNTTAAGEADGARVPIQIGQIIAGKYRLELFLGQGGMALIYKAVHIGMAKPVVLKFVQAHLLKDEINLKRFEHECLAMARMNHPNVASIYDTGVINGTQPYLVMEYVDGESLADLLEKKGAIPVTFALEVLIQVCSGLAEAHKAGIIHRDIKTANIMLQERGERPDWVKLVDFGLAHLSESNRLTEAGMVVGSMGCIAPEQLRGMQIDHRVDIYALGMVLFEMLTGDLPYSANNTAEFFIKQLQDTPELLSNKCTNVAPGSRLDLVVKKSIERDPEKRFQSATELRQALELVLQEIAGKAEKSTTAKSAAPSRFSLKKWFFPPSQDKT